MGLTAGKDYSEKKVQEAVRAVTGNDNLVVTIKSLGSGNATLVVGGAQLPGSFSSKGENIVWAQKIQDLVKDELGGGTLDWRGS